MSVEAKLSQMSIAHPSFTEVFDNVPKNRLRELVEADSGPIETKTVSRTTLKKIIFKSIEGVAVRTLADNLKKEQLATALEPLAIDHKKAGNNPNSKRVLYKRFLEQVSEVGIAAFIREHVEVDLAKQMAEAVNVKATGKTSEAIGKQIADQLEHEAVVAYWEAFDVETLHDIAYDMKLEDKEPETPSKTVLIEAIMNNESVQKLEKKRPKTEQLKLVPSKNKPSKIADGISFDDLHYWWSVDDLRKWAKDHAVISTGNKPELINRILAFLAGDKENTTVKAPSQRVRKPRKKSEETKKRLAKAKKNKAKKEAEGAAATEPAKKKTPAAKPVKETKQAAAAAKPAAKETKPVAAPEPEEVVEASLLGEIELDNLDQYSLAQLKQYCKEEEVEVTGKTKKDYIAAILAYNESDGEGEEEEEEEDGDN